MSNAPTVLVLGRRRTDNMPSLTRMLEILKPREGDTAPGMDATVTSSVRITGRSTVEPTMGDKCWVCGAPISSGTVCDSCNKGPGERAADDGPARRLIMGHGYPTCPYCGTPHDVSAPCPPEKKPKVM